MNDDGSKTILKDLLNARLQNPKYVYDGKRMQPVYDRQCYDCSSAIIYQAHLSPIPPIKYAGFDLGHQMLSIPTPDECAPADAAPSRFAHLSINKARSPVNTLTWNSDGRRLISGSSSGEITLWNGFSFNFDTIVQAHESPIRCMSWSPSSSFLVTCDNLGLIKYWSPSMSNLEVVQGHREGIKDLSFCYNDTHFCSASDDSTIKIWDSIETKCLRTLKGHNWDVRKAQWHPSKALIASGGKDNLVKFWDPRTDKCLGTLHSHKNTVLSLRFAGEGYLLTGGKDQVVKMYDVRRMKEVFTYKTPGKEATALTTHGHTELFVTGCNDGSVQYWDWFLGVPLSEVVEKHEGIVWALDFHPGGHALASGSADCTIKFWIRPRPQDIEEEKEVVEIMEDSAEMRIPGL